ncbi:hypothetical protein VTI28DRAFT_5522 [Corynascus sepedonium]
MASDTSGHRQSKSTCGSSQGNRHGKHCSYCLLFSLCLITRHSYVASLPSLPPAPRLFKAKGLASVSQEQAAHPTYPSANDCPLPI